MQTYTYDVPQALFSEHFVQQIRNTSQTHQTLVISANADHVRWLKQHPALRAMPQLEIRTIQSALITQLNRFKRRTVLSATGRTALVYAAWQRVDGVLFQQYGSKRGAVGEISNALTWISQQRQQWQHVAAELDMHSELAQIYAEYCASMDAQDVIGYDDVALHVCDLPHIPRQHDIIIACELQYATSAQLQALQRLMRPHSHDWAAAWVSPTTAVPELQTVYQWLCSFSSPRPYAQPVHPAYSASLRILGHTTAACQISVIGSHGGQYSVAGASTVVDECQAVARLTYERISAGRSVSIVCTDDSLLSQVRAALGLHGIVMPPLKPATFQNPLIRLAQGAFHWHASPSQDEQAHLISHMMQLPFVATQSHAHRASLQDTMQRLYASLDIMQEVAPQLSRIIQQCNALTWVWGQNVIPNDITDQWIRDYHQWLDRVREIDRIIAAGAFDAMQRFKLLRNVDTLPTQLVELYRTTLPLQLHNHTGAAGASDCVIIMGLSEHVAPRQATGYQFISEATLVSIFASRRVNRPGMTDNIAWREREARRVARMLGTHANECIVSFSYYAANGQQQLPSPYFERLFDGVGHFDRNGYLLVTKNAVQIHRCDDLPVPQANTPLQPVQLTLKHSDQFSASQIKTYIQCPRRYFYEKVLRLGTESEELDERAMDMGSLMHEILCAAVGNGQIAGVDLRNESIDATRARWATMSSRVLQIADAAWRGEECRLSNGDVYTPTQHWRLRFGSGLRQLSSERKLQAMCHRWLNGDPCMTLDPSRRPILLEQQLHMRIGEFTLTGRIDRIDEITAPNGQKSYHIIDYKSGTEKSYLDVRRQFLPDEHAAATDYQIPIYLYGTQTSTWMLTPPTSAMSLIYLNNKKQSVGVRTVTMHHRESRLVGSGNTATEILLSYADLNRMINIDMVATMHHMQQYPYPTIPSRTCAYCPFTSICDDSAV